MTPRTFLAVVLGVSIAAPILAEEVWPHPDQVESRSLGRWTLIRKKYCSLGGCGRTSPPYSVDFLIFAGDTIQGKGFQNISTPFGRHAWESLYPCDCGNRRWISLDEPYSMPIPTVEDALRQCQISLPRPKYVKYEKLAYHPSDSLTILPWELRRSGEGWSVLRVSGHL